jgi:hypothetical protein
MQYGGYFPATYSGYNGYSGQQVSPDMQAQNMQQQALAQAQAAQQQRMQQAQMLQNMQMQPMMQQGVQQNQPQPQQIQNGGIIPIKDENEARNYPVAPGTSFTFVDEQRKHLFIKTVGLNMFDKFDFRRFLIIEEKEEPQEEEQRDDRYSGDIEALKAYYEELKQEIAGLKRQIESKPAVEPVSATKKKPAVKKEEKV